MIARQLMALLANADPDAEILFLCWPTSCDYVEVGSANILEAEAADVIDEDSNRVAAGSVLLYPH